MNDNLSKATDMNVERYISILMENRQEHTIMYIVVFTDVYAEEEERSSAILNSTMYLRVARTF